MNFIEFVKKHFYMIVIVLLVATLGVNTGVSVLGTVSPKAMNVSKDVMEVLVGDTIDTRLAPLKASIEALQVSTQRIEDQLNKKDEYPVLLMEYELNKYSTPAEVENAVDTWISDGWGAQLTAMRYVSDNQETRERLRQLIIYQDVYLAFIQKARRY